MPFVSKAQRRKFHVLKDQATISASTVREFERATAGKKLPERVRPSLSK